MKICVFILLVLVAFLNSSVGAPDCGAGGSPDLTWPSKCNCYSGYAPSTKAALDCNLNPLCPPILKTDQYVGEYGAQNPITSFYGDKLNILQRLPIVANRLGTSIRLVHPVGISGVTAGSSGASTCSYPGVLWNKTVNGDFCIDEFRGSIPWNSHQMCGFVLDTNLSNNSTAIYRATLVTQYNETFIGWNGQTELQVHSKAYSIAVSFLKRATISNMVVNITMSSPSLSVVALGNVIFDTTSGNTQLTLRTSANWPYSLSGNSLSFVSFTSNLPSGQAPTGIVATIQQDMSQSLTCNSVENSICFQQWIVAIKRGSASNCDMEGQYKFTSTLSCRDSNPCSGQPNGSFAFSLMATDYCTSHNIDATSNSVYKITAYQDVSHLIPTSYFPIGSTAYFLLSVVDPTSTLKGITFSNIALLSQSDSKDILYSTSGLPIVSGINLKIQEVNAIVRPGTEADLSFSFQLIRSNLPNTLSQVIAGGNGVSLSVEATINLVYYSDKKREVQVVMELSQGSATTQIYVVPEDQPEELEDEVKSNGGAMYTFPFIIILALLSLWL